MNFILKLETNLRAGPGRPRSTQLGSRTLIVGPNGSGKSRIQHAIELLVSERADDLLGRESVAQVHDLQLAVPTGELLSIRGTFAEGTLAGKTASFEIRQSSTGGLSSWTDLPFKEGNPWTVPVRHVRTALAGSVENARKFLLPFVVENVTVDDIRRRLPAQFTGKGGPNEGIIPDSAIALLAEMERIRGVLKEEKSQADGAARLVTELKADLEAEPTDAEMDEAEAILRTIEGMEKEAGRQATARRLAMKEEELGLFYAQLDAYQKQVAAACPIVRAPTDEEKKRARWAESALNVCNELIESNLPLCLSCGSKVTPATLHQHRVNVEQAVAVWGKPVKDYEAVTTYRTTADKAIADARAAREEPLKSAIVELREIIGTTPLSPNWAHTEEDLAQKRAIAQQKVDAMRLLRARWDQIRQAETRGVEATQNRDAWKRYGTALSEVAEYLLQNGLKRFCDRVQRHLPEGRGQFSLTLREGKRDVCRFGLMRNGRLELSLSGAEEAFVLFAITAAILDVLPGGPPPYVLFALPDERAWDPRTLRQLMGTLDKIPYQVILCSTVGYGTGKPPKGWTVITLEGSKEPTDPITSPAPEEGVSAASEA